MNCRYLCSVIRNSWARRSRYGQYYLPVALFGSHLRRGYKSTEWRVTNTTKVRLQILRLEGKKYNKGEVTNPQTGGGAEIQQKRCDKLLDWRGRNTTKEMLQILRL